MLDPDVDPPWLLADNVDGGALKGVPIGRLGVCIGGGPGVCPGGLPAAIDG